MYNIESPSFISLYCTRFKNVLEQILHMRGIDIWLKKSRSGKAAVDVDLKIISVHPLQIGPTSIKL